MSREKAKTMTQDLESRVAALEATVAALRAALNGGAPAVQTATSKPASAGEVASDDLMSRDWADMEIRKDPPRAKESFVGRRMSECTESYLLDYAAFHDWKAAKGRQENPPRLNNKGKPFFEGDELVAKIARGWAARASNKTRPKSAPKPAQKSMGEPELEDLPF